MIAFSCTCGHKYNVSEEYAGKKVRCKHCNAITQVPSGQPQEEQQIPLPNTQPAHTTTEYHSSRKIWCISALLISVFCIGFGLLIYTQHNKNKREKALCATCEILIEEAETLISQKEYKNALEKYLTVEELISDSGFDSSDINYLLEDSEEQIQILKNKIYANLHLPELTKIKKEADVFFNKGDFDSATEKYAHIVAFIKTYQKQKDINFKSMLFYNEKRIDFIKNLKIALAYGKSDWNKHNRTVIDKLYAELIKELRSLRAYPESIVKIVAKLEEMKVRANAYYDDIERQKAIAKREEENRRIAEREKQLAAAKANETTKRIKSTRTVTQVKIEFFNAINPTMKQLVHISNGLSANMFNYQTFNEEIRKLMEMVEECSAWTAANKHKFKKGTDSRLAESMMKAIDAQDSYINTDNYWNKMIINASEEILVIELKRARDFNIQMAIMHGDAATFAYNSYAKQEPFELAKKKYNEKLKRILAYLESYKAKNGF